MEDESNTRRIILPGGPIQRKSQLAIYNDLFFRMMEAAALIDVETFQVYDANDSFERMAGVGISQLYGRSVFEWVLEKERDEFIRMLRVVRRRNFAQSWENTWISSDGRTLTVVTSACRLDLTDGSEVIQLLFRDVTLERRAELEIESFVGKLQEAHRQLASILPVDPVTQLPNSKGFQERLKMEHSRAERSETEYSVLELELEGFRDFTEKNGRFQAEELLKIVASALREGARPHDSAARLEGGRFALLCPEMGEETALRAAKKLKAALAGVTCPVNMAVATYPGAGPNLESLAEALRATAELARNAGGGRIVAASEAARKRRKAA